MAAETPTIGDDAGDDTCYKCKIVFDDVKTIIQCTVCKKYYHGKCENVDLRGFHMKKLVWKCRSCLEISGELNKPDRSRKRSRTEEAYIDQETINTLNATLDMLVNNTKSLNEKIELLIEENRLLKLEVADVKRMQPLQLQAPRSDEVMMSYSTAAAKKVNKVLVVKSKETQKDVKEVKKDLRNKIDPTEMGVGVSMGRVTRKGGLILNCDSNQEISSIQSEIQDKLGDGYEVERPKTLQHRIKVVGVDESDFETDDSAMISKLIKQNDILNVDNSFNMRIMRKTKVVKSKFNLIIELDQNTYSSVISKGKINIGWNRCPVYNEYGIVRCFKCCKYGHFIKDCKEKQVCPKCSEEHILNVCHSNVAKCSNCVLSNKKYGMSLNVEHTTWDRSKCETLKRIENLQIQKYQK